MANFQEGCYSGSIVFAFCWSCFKVLFYPEFASIQRSLSNAFFQVDIDAQHAQLKFLALRGEKMFCCGLVVFGLQEKCWYFDATYKLYIPNLQYADGESNATKRGTNHLVVTE